jgi:hypothetical protein
MIGLRGQRRVRSDALRRVMPDPLRYTVYVGFGGLWLSGCGWWLLHHFAAGADEFGVLRHPWETPLRLAHGVLAIATAYLFGWILARHATESWRNGKRRVSGGVFSCVLGVLSLSGFALFFVSSDAWQAWTAWLHEILGLAVTVLAVEHWRIARQPTEETS